MFNIVTLVPCGCKFLITLLEKNKQQGHIESQKAPSFKIVLGFDCNNRKRDELEGKKIPDLFAETEEKQY